MKSCLLLRQSRLAVALAVVLCGFTELSSAYWGGYGGGGGADAYTAMSDIDWGKRSDRDWISPAYSYSSMADGDWGWRKRSPSSYYSSQEDDSGDDNESTGGSSSTLQKQPAWRQYYYRYQQPKALESRRSSAGSYGYGGGYTYNPAPSRPVFNRDKAWNYHSMADLDWGWKKRKRSSGVARTARAAVAAKSPAH